MRDLLKAQRLLSELTPDEMLTLHYILLGRLSDLEWPQLVETTTESGSLVWRCPRCDAETDPVEAICAVDVAERWTSPYDYADGKLFFNYEGSGEYDPLFYACQACDKPVRPPSNVTEEW